MKSIKLIFCLLLSTPSFSHEVRPAYFSVVQETKNEFNITWKLPAMGEAVPKITPVIPNHWELKSEKSNLLPGNLRRSYRVVIHENIEGSILEFEGQETTMIDILISVKLLNGSQYSKILKPSDSKFEFPTEPERTSQAKIYLGLGVEHILMGIDHLLFVLALLLITEGFKKLLKTVTAFTIAHSITLSLSALGIIGLPSAPVEAVIALSIVFLAVELYHYNRGKEGLTSKSPWVVAFAFGLLHGFGFAGALADIGLPQTDVPVALLFFNLGVEFGQILFILFVLGIIWALKRMKVNWPVWLKRSLEYVIGGVASMWLIERLLTFV